MYYNEAIALLRTGPIGLKAKRTCWDNSFIIYNAFLNELTFIKKSYFKENDLDKVLTTTYTFVPSQSDCENDDWEIFE